MRANPDIIRAALIRAIFFVVLFVLALSLIGMALPVGDANAAPDAQFVTSTPGPDGRIIYIVVAGDSCSSIALLHGIGVEQLRQLNSRLDENCTVTVGQQMVVGLAPANAPTAGAAPTLPPVTPSATPVTGTTEVCVLLFDDLNGDALRQETEFGIDGGTTLFGVLEFLDDDDAGAFSHDESVAVFVPGT